MSALYLSPNFTLDEAIVTQQRDVNNYPPKGIIAAMGITAENMEHVRAALGGKPIKINSWYRSPELNAKIGGSKKSAHMEGRAVDFICPAFGTPFEVCRELEKHRSELMFDQLIYEHTWIHIAFAIPPAIPRLEVLTLVPETKSYVSGIVLRKGVKK